MSFPSKSIQEAVERAKENITKLNSCSKPHDFSIPTSESPFFAKHECSKCGGKVDSASKIWYERGLEDAKESS